MFQRACPLIVSRSQNRRFSQFLVLCALLCALASWPTQPAHARANLADGSFEPALVAALEQLLDQSVAKSTPGAALAVFVPGRGMWVGARGLADRDAGVPLAHDMLFGAGSISKLFVATVAMQLVQEGWLSLDQTVEHWLPGLVPHGDRIAVRYLMNHTSGLPDYLDEPFAEMALADPTRVWTPGELVRSALERRPAVAPGRWRYSNTNYVLLGLIIEQVTHNSLAREVHQRIIGPLGLAHTFFSPDDPIARAMMHGYEGRRHLTGGMSMSFAWGAGNIISNVEDLGRFAQALFGGALLRPEIFALMQAVVATGGWGSRDLIYGLGLMQDVLRGSQPTLVRGHTGALMGYRTALWHAPDSGVTIVVALNQELAEPDIVATRVFDALRSQGAM
jgi:D-alanyl-D-alanine carboxypeptidase